MISKSLILGSVVLLSMSFKCGHSTNCEAYGGMQEKTVKTFVKQKMIKSQHAEQPKVDQTRRK